MDVKTIISEIKAIDKGAFVIINDVREVLGEGFSSYTDY